MFQIINKYLVGFYKLKITGISYMRFLNLCAARNILTWDINRGENEASCFIYRRDLENVKDAAEKSGVDIEVLNEKGIYYFFCNYKKRIMLFTGFIICIGLVLFQGCFIWNISVGGDHRYTKEEIIDYVNVNFDVYGTMKSKVDCEEIEKALRRDFSDIAWVTCAIKGTRLKIDIKMSLSVHTDTSLDVPSNVTAIKDCTITSIVTAHGTPVVTCGDEVKKGDILISGAVYLYDDNEEVLDTVCVPAKGMVYGLTEYEYKNEFSMNYNTKEYTGQNDAGYIIGIGNRYFSFSSEEKKYENSDMFEDEHILHIGDDFYLPLSVTKISEKEYKLNSDIYTEEEAISRAEKALNIFIDDLKEKGVQIVSNNVKISIENDLCTASGTIKVIEPVGISTELNTFNTGEPEDNEEENIE